MSTAYPLRAPAGRIDGSSAPDPGCLRDRRLIDIFDRYAGVGSGRSVLELSRSRSGWSSFLAAERGCDVSSVRIIGRDAVERLEARLPDETFDLVFSIGVIDRLERPVRHLAALARAVRPGGRILTTVPNLRAWNGWLEWIGNPPALHEHAIYGLSGLRALHDVAGFRPVAWGRAGFFDVEGVARCGPSTGARRILHRGLCGLTRKLAQAWVGLTGGRIAPETPLLSPHLYVVGIKP